jgi:hypothetical protein
MEMIQTTAELNKQNPPPFVASQSGSVEKMPTATEEEQIRALFKEAASQGVEELNTPIIAPKAPPVEQPYRIADQPNLQIPQKFQKSDGTVDEDKLKASSERLNEAVAQKQKTVEELLSEYQEREKKLHGLSQQAAEIKQQMPPIPVPMPQVQQDPQALEQRLRQDFQRDALDTTVKLTDAMLEAKLAPFRERFAREEEMQRVAQMRQNVANLAQQDPRFLDPRLNAMVNQVLDEEPGMMRLKNPHKAAWNEVKERLRLGEANMPPAQPSNVTPTLGGGAPPSVSTLPGPMSVQSLQEMAKQVNPYSPEGRQLEERLKDATKDLWQY